MISPSAYSREVTHLSYLSLSPSQMSVPTQRIFPRRCSNRMRGGTSSYAGDEFLLALLFFVCRHSRPWPSSLPSPLQPHPQLPTGSCWSWIGRIALAGIQLPWSAVSPPLPSSSVFGAPCAAAAAQPTAGALARPPLPHPYAALLHGC
jgi:hypothetical protein